MAIPIVAASASASFAFVAISALPSGNPEQEVALALKRVRDDLVNIHVDLLAPAV